MESVIHTSYVQSVESLISPLPRLPAHKSILVRSTLLQSLPLSPLHLTHTLFLFFSSLLSFPPPTSLSSLLSSSSTLSLLTLSLSLSLSLIAITLPISNLHFLLPHPRRTINPCRRRRLIWFILSITSSHFQQPFRVQRRRYRTSEDGKGKMLKRWERKLEP